MDSLKKTLEDRKVEYASLQRDLEAEVPFLNENPKRAEQILDDLEQGSRRGQDDVVFGSSRRKRGLEDEGAWEEEEEVGEENELSFQKLYISTKSYSA